MAGEAAVLVRSAILRIKGAVHRPTPSLFTYPGLRSQAFWDPAAFPGVKELQDNLPTVLKEYEAASQKLQNDYDVAANESTLHKGGWEWRSLVSKGKLQTGFQLLCPTTSAILQRMPLMTGLPFSYAFFSEMNGGVSIDPHYGPCNLRVRVHMPLIVPSEDPAQCAFTLAGETRPWKVGQPLVFDDCYLHSSKNLTKEKRVLLLFDLWHPELHEEEKEAVLSMFDEARKKGWLS